MCVGGINHLLIDVDNEKQYHSPLCCQNNSLQHLHTSTASRVFFLNLPIRKRISALARYLLLLRFNSSRDGIILDYQFNFKIIICTVLNPNRHCTEQSQTLTIYPYFLLV